MILTPWTLEVSHGLKQAMAIRDVKWFRNKLWQYMDIRDVAWFETWFKNKLWQNFLVTAAAPN